MSPATRSIEAWLRQSARSATPWESRPSPSASSPRKSSLSSAASGSALPKGFTSPSPVPPTNFPTYADRTAPIGVISDLQGNRHSRLGGDSYDSWDVIGNLYPAARHHQLDRHRERHRGRIGNARRK